MSRILQSRLPLILLKRNGRFFSSTLYTDPPKEPIVASTETLLHDQPPPPSDAPQKKSSSWGLLKFGIYGALTGALATAGYATYAYSLEEVDKKTKSIRETINYTIPNDASSLEKFQAMLYSATMKVPAISIEFYLDLRRSIEEQVRGFAEPPSDKLLPDLIPEEQHVFTIVLDLNETLIYSDWKQERGWRTFKRAGVDAFLEHLAQFYEIVLYTDSQFLDDKIIQRLDPKGCIRFKLSRTHTKYQDGKHYRDLSKLNRDPRKIIYISGHAFETSLQPENSVPIKPWKLESDDTALLDLIPFLEYVARYRPADIRPVLASYQGRDIATEFIERTKEHQRRVQEQRNQGRLWRH